MDSKVTFIMPLYNKAQYVIETLESIKNQTIKDFEVIIVDDKSTDDSFSVVSNFIKNDERFHLYQLEKNSGSSVARNFALDHVKTQYVSFIDADDLLDSTYLESQLNFIKDNGPIIVSSYRRMNKDNLPDFIVPKETDYKSLLKGNPLACLTTMYDYSLFKEDRFPIDMKRHEDYVFWLRIIKRGYIAKGNQEVLATYRLLDNSKNSSKIKLIKPMHAAYRKVGFNYFKAWILTLNYCLYSRKKYKND